MRALGEGRLEEVARLIGYAPRPERIELPPERPARAAAAPTAGRSTRAARGEPGRYWRAEVFEAFDPDGVERQLAADLALVRAEARGGSPDAPAVDAPPPAARLPGPRNRLLTALRQAAAIPRPVGDPDVDRLLRRFDRAEILRRIPRLPRRRWGGRIRVVVDRAAHLKPYDSDHDLVCDEIRALLPEAALAWDVCVGPHDLHAEPDDETLIVLGDLGTLSPAQATDMAAWEEVGRRLKSAGVRPVAFLCAAPRVSLAPIARVWSVAGWEPWWLSHEPDEGELERLRAIVAPAIRVEPGLLRGLRLLLADHPLQRGRAPPLRTECEFWMSDYFRARHIEAADPVPEERQRAMAAFDALPRDLGERALGLIAAWRGDAPWAGANEWMDLAPESRVLAPRSSRAGSVEWLHEFAEELSSTQGRRRGGASFFRRFVGRRPAETLRLPEDVEIADDLDAAAVRVVETAVARGIEAVFGKGRVPELPEHVISQYRPERLGRAIEGEATIRLSQSGKTLEAGEESQGPRSLLAAIRARAPEVIAETLPPLWRSGAPPSWAHAWGEDACGPWVEFHVPVAGAEPVAQRMRWIPPGEFMLGSPEDEPGRYADEGPRRPVRIAEGFWMFETPCTQALWQAVMGTDPSAFKSPDRPVDNVSWDDAQAFIRRINARVPGLDLALPSEARWEYACRAGSDAALYTGPIEILGEANAPALDPIAWYGGNSSIRFELSNGQERTWLSEMQYPDGKAGSHPVGKKAPNAFGLHDMLGNVWEWCADDWFPDHQEAPADGAARVPVDGAPRGAERVMRGGSWIVSARLCRSACRIEVLPDFRSDYFGFRCARVQGGAEPVAARRIRPAERRIAASRPGGAGGGLLVPGGPEARWELPPAAPFVIRTDCEAITFGLMDRPRWANAMGRDRFGLWARFELEGRDGARVGQRLRWIPPGRFWMGSPEGEWDRSGNQRPPPEVQFAEGFWLADTACAQALWTAVMGENPSRFKDAEESSRRPVERVSWDDVQTFLSRINERVDGLDLALPSEAQWEYACRAGTDTPFSFGSKIDPGMVNYDDNYPYRDARGGLYREETVPVGILPPNSWGLYEMHGNVWEWCADDWFESHDGAPKHGVVRIATNGAARGAERVLRGGSWGDPAGFCRSACRFGYHPAVRNVGIGFRCARVQG